MHESIKHLVGLRRRLTNMAASEGGVAGGRFATGHEGLDVAFGGGLARGRLHEFFADGPENAASATGMAAMLALRAGTGKTEPTGARDRASRLPVLWLQMENMQRRGGHFHAPGFAELGGDPDDLLLALAPDALSLLRCAADATRCTGLGVVIVEAWGSFALLDLTASRRLVLAAEQSGVTVFLLRIDARPIPSAAETRWLVKPAPSLALKARAPGNPGFELELLRQRSGPSGMRWHLEWCRDQCLFREPALSGAMVPLSPRRQAETPAASVLRRRT